MAITLSAGSPHAKHGTIVEAEAGIGLSMNVATSTETMADTTIAGARTMAGTTSAGATASTTGTKTHSTIPVHAH